MSPRAATDTYVDEEPNLLQRHDLVVVIAALALLAAGSLGYRSLTEPKVIRFSKVGLSFDRPASWLPPQSVRPPKLRLSPPASRAKPAGVTPTQPTAPEPQPAIAPPEPAAPGATVSDPAATDSPATPAGQAPVTAPRTTGIHLLYTSANDAYARLEVRIAPRPQRFNVRGALGLERRARYGDLYWSASGKVVEIQATEWVRTRFRYAYKANENDSPRVATGIEYATLNGELLYVVTLHGSQKSAETLAARIEPTLSVDQTVPEAGDNPAPVKLAASHRLPSAGKASMVNQVFPATVMVVAIDHVNGRLEPVAGGSGTIVADDGSVLTNYHVLFDRKRARLHDLFAIGRYRAPNRDPEFVCAGRPTFSKLDPSRDLALIKCDLDMNGHPFTPKSWPSIVPRKQPVVPGETIYLVSYPDIGGGTIDVSVGRVNGFSGEKGGAGDDFIRTDARISPGSSGGAAVDENGKLLGVPTAYRMRVADDGTKVVPLARVGLVRPIDRAGRLLALARKGWIPGDAQLVQPVKAGASSSPA